MSKERIALIDAFKEKSEGLDQKYEARTHKSDWIMPYRLFRPASAGRVQRSFRLLSISTAAAARATTI